MSACCGKLGKTQGKEPLDAERGDTGGPGHNPGLPSLRWTVISVKAYFHLSKAILTSQEQPPQSLRPRFKS